MRIAVRLISAVLLSACRQATEVAATAPCAGVGISLQPAAVALAVGERATVQVPKEVLPCRTEMPSGRIIWVVSDTSVARVADGVVEGRRVGATTVRATFLEDFRWTASAIVTVR